MRDSSDNNRLTDLVSSLRSVTTPGPRDDETRSGDVNVRPELVRSVESHAAVPHHLVDLDAREEVEGLLGQSGDMAWVWSSPGQSGETCWLTFTDL